jgi:23S rRNA (pseudouridine1915-N3)-methyltransferase
MALRVAVAAVGRLRKGPEHALTAAYLDRFQQTGRAIGLGPARVVEVDERRHRGAAAEASALLDAVSEGPVVALDERGATLDSPGLAALLAEWRDSGAREAAFLIGGADGHGAAVRERASRLLSLGPMVWPHMLVRVMLAEQLYRAAGILAGTPYHRA